MRMTGGLLVAMGLGWIILCFGGTAMMSRSVTVLTEAFTPSLLGVAACSIGICAPDLTHET